jgi:hypothetical protein
MPAEYYLNRRYGSLVVKRILDDGRLFCICEPVNGRVCNGERTVKPSELSSCKQCRRCARLWRQGKSDKAHILPPKVEPVREEPEPSCKGCGMLTVDRITYDTIQPTCPKHGIVTS